MNEKLKKLLTKPAFPRSARYDPLWVLENQMGPHPLWLTEWLCQGLNLKRGMRILDLGCGKGLSSIFLAKEFGTQVWATDLWISASDNRKRIEAAGLIDTVYPIHCDARNLPYAEEFFDAIVCVDAYIYFGTDDLYLDYLHKFVKPGGQIGIVVPGFMQELAGSLPEHLHPFWAQECWTWHTVTWWRRHWERTGLVELLCADSMPDGWKFWLDWKYARRLVEGGHPGVESDIQVLRADSGRYMGFVRMIAERN